MTEPAKTSQGQFAKGRSGNPKGRPRRENGAGRQPPATLRTEADFSEALLRIGHRTKSVTEGGKTEEMTLIEINMLQLATNGKDRLARKDFVELTRSALRHLDNAKRYPKR